MPSFKAQLRLQFPGYPDETRLLIKACKKVGLSEEQKLHLLSRVLYSSEALTYWATRYRASAKEGEKYLISMAPHREETPPTLLTKLKFGLSRVITPVARAMGLM
ncbi:MAG: hypothetical protein Q7R64_01125 [bacterium]|nr:hypothetical protein [bacterium]